MRIEQKLLLGREDPAEIGPPTICSLLTTLAQDLMRLGNRFYKPLPFPLRLGPGNQTSGDAVALSVENNRFADGYARGYCNAL
jgi:hypothetical protein